LFKSGKSHLSLGKRKGKRGKRNKKLKKACKDNYSAGFFALKEHHHQHRASPYVPKTNDSKP